MDPQSPQARMEQLSIYRTGRQPQIVALELDRYELGRADTNQLSFPDADGLSRKHAIFERDRSQWSLRDLGSTNGTFLNGARITEPMVLRPGDRVSIGELSIVFSRLAPAPRLDRTVVFIEKPNSPAATTMEDTLAGVLDSDQEIQGSPHMRALIQAGRELCGHLPLDELFNVIMQLSVDAVGASRGVLVTVDAGQFNVRATKGAGFRISSHVRDVVINERRSLLVQDALTDEALAARMSIIQERVRGILAVPLQTDKSAIGLIYLDSPVLVREFTKDDLNVLTVLANIAAIRIEQARLAEIEQSEKLRARELEHASLIQRSMLPVRMPPFPDRKDFDLHGSMTPAKEVGGDLFDCFLLDEEHLGFAIGDVSGKGVPAALFMAVARTLLRASAQNQKSPGEVFTYMNHALVESNEAGMFVTFFYGVLNTRTGELHYANAGHNPPYIFSDNGVASQLPGKSGPMLGVFDGREYTTLSTRIEPGQGVLLYTDGVTEAVDKNREFFGEERVESYLAQAPPHAEPLVRGLHAAVQNFANGMPQADDITVLAIMYLGDR
jgi:sigma-B regulation protein RsbU (phosphoserine phosphatase)